MQNAIWCFTDLEARWDHYDNLLWVIQQICITPEFDSSPFASRYLATIELIRNRSYRDHWAFTCLSLQSTLQTLSIQPEWLYLLIHTNCNQSCRLLAAGTLVHRKGGEKKDDCPKPMRMMRENSDWCYTKNVAKISKTTPQSCKKQSNSPKQSHVLNLTHKQRCLHW